MTYIRKDKFNVIKKFFLDEKLPLEYYLITHITKEVNDFLLIYLSLLYLITIAKESKVKVFNKIFRSIQIDISNTLLENGLDKDITNKVRDGNIFYKSIILASSNKFKKEFGFRVAPMINKRRIFKSGNLKYKPLRIYFNICDWNRLYATDTTFPDWVMQILKRPT